MQALIASLLAGCALFLFGLYLIANADWLGESDNSPPMSFKGVVRNPWGPWPYGRRKVLVTGWMFAVLGLLVILGAIGHRLAQ